MRGLRRADGERGPVPSRTEAPRRTCPVLAQRPGMAAECCRTDARAWAGTGRQNACPRRPQAASPRPGTARKTPKPPSRPPASRAPVAGLMMHPRLTALRRHPLPLCTALAHPRIPLIRGIRPDHRTGPRLCPSRGDGRTPRRLPTGAGTATPSAPSGTLPSPQQRDGGGSACVSAARTSSRPRLPSCATALPFPQQRPFAARTPRRRPAGAGTATPSAPAGTLPSPQQRDEGGSACVSAAQPSSRLRLPSCATALPFPQQRPFAARTPRRRPAGAGTATPSATRRHSAVAAAAGRGRVCWRLGRTDLLPVPTDLACSHHRHAKPGGIRLPRRGGGRLTPDIGGDPVPTGAPWQPGAHPATDGPQAAGGRPNWQSPPVLY